MTSLRLVPKLLPGGLRKSSHNETSFTTLQNRVIYVQQGTVHSNSAEYFWRFLCCIQRYLLHTAMVVSIRESSASC